jgi:SHS2 domain-containing protein
MAMGSEIKQQILYESFDMFKDDWDNNVDTLKSTIAKMATIDLSAAIQMWVYLLNKHSRKIKTDSEITSGILNQLPEESYEEIVDTNFIIEKIFKYSCEPWESTALISYFISKTEYYTANKILELVSTNKTVSEYNYTDYKSSNLSTCLYKTLDRLYNLTDSDIEFFSTWIERIEDKSEKMKLKVLMLSKESTETPIYRNNSIKNNYLLENASLEELDFASTRREEFEIKKLIEMICNYTIHDIDMSRLDIRWICDVFAEQSGYSKSAFNIIGAYFFINSFSWETKNIIEKVYKDKSSIKSIAQNSYNGDTESTIKQRLDLVFAEINIYRSVWDFNYILNFCNNILSLSNAFQNYLTAIKHRRTVEINQYYDIRVSTLGISSRIDNILLQNNIITIPQLIELLDSGVHLEGLGNKSMETLRCKIESLGIKLCSVYDDLNFIFKTLGIEGDAYTLNGIYDIAKKFKIPQSSINWNLRRQDLQRYIDTQSQIANDFLDRFSNKCNDIPDYLSLLRKDDDSVYLPGRYFFININKNNPRLHII